MLCLQGCLRELGIGEEVPKASLTIRLNLPAGTESNVSTKAGYESGGEYENTINALYIYLYTKSTAVGNSTGWSLLTSRNVTASDIPDISTDGSASMYLDISDLPITEEALNGDISMLAVVYANYNSAQAAVSSEADFWDQGVLEPMFFGGSAEFAKSGDVWVANVDITRQLAKLRVKLGIHPDAVPSNLEIDYSSIAVEVEGMPNWSPTVASDQEDPADTFTESAVQRNISRSASATANTLRSATGTSGSWESGLVVDSLYMHPNSSTSDAVTVSVSMTVKDPVSGALKQIEEEYDIINSDGNYSTTRNTIYTLEVLVKSIDGEFQAESTVDTIEWDDTSISVDVPWGEFEIDNTRALAILGYSTPNKLLTIKSGEGSSWNISLVSDKTSGNVVDGSVAQLYDGSGSAYSGNTLTLSSQTELNLYISAADSFTGAYLKIMTAGDTGLVRYIPVGVVTLDIPGTIYADAFGTSVAIEALVKWPDSTDTEPLDLTFQQVSQDGTATTNSSWWSYDSDDSEITVNAQTGEDVQFGSIVSDYDLSMRSGTMNTANCYIVNAAGTYKFPLVYGNAIKDGADNTTAYRPGGTASSTYMSSFVDHAGVAIDSPYIYQSNGGANTPDAASIIWQDAPDLVSSVSLNGQYVEFTVQSENLTEGNAIIAATRNGTVVWSWHIWVTTYDPYGTGDSDGTIAVTNAAGQVFHFMREYLGACDPSNSPAREAYIKIYLSGYDIEPSDLYISQEGLTTFGDNVYFQNGRKDPFPGIDSNNTTQTKQTWGTYAWDYTLANGQAPTSYRNSMSVAQSIQYPYIWNTNTSSHYTNLWNGTQTGYTGNALNAGTVEKTVYDPSPAGFCVPTNAAFSGFSTSGATQGSLNSPYTYSQVDLYLPLYTDDTKQSVFNFRTVSYRLNESTNGYGSIYDVANRTSQITLGTADAYSSGPVPTVIFLVYDSQFYIDFWGYWAQWGNARCILPVKEPENGAWPE